MFIDLIANDYIIMNTKNLFKNYKKHMMRN